MKKKKKQRERERERERESKSVIEWGRDGGEEVELSVYHRQFQASLGWLGLAWWRSMWNKLGEEMVGMYQ